jgi:hypothetical protein
MTKLALARVILAMTTLLGVIGVSGALFAAPIQPTPSGTTPDLGRDGASALLFGLTHASARATRAAHHLITFNVASVNTSSADAVAEAGRMASEAIVAAAAQPSGERLLAPIQSVDITVGATPSVNVVGGLINLVVNPSKDVDTSLTELLIQRAVSLQR